MEAEQEHEQAVDRALRAMRDHLAQVRILDTALGDAKRCRRTPQGDRLGSRGYEGWRASRTRLKEEQLVLYREARDELNRLSPGFDVKQAIRTTKLLRRAGALLTTLREDLGDDLDPEELELIKEIEDHLQEV